MMVAKIISVLACLVLIHEARAKDGGSDGCSDFPFAVDPFWGGAEAEFPESELLLMERNSSLFTGELRLTHGEKDLSDPLRNRLPEFVRCWKGRGFVEVTLTDGEGKESESVGGTSWKYRFLNRGRFRFENLTRCESYKVRAELFRGDRRKGRSAGTLFSGVEAAVPPSPFDSPAVQVEEGITEASVKVRPEDDRCLKYAESATVSCKEGGVYRTDHLLNDGASTVLGQLFPNTTYECRAQAQYASGTSSLFTEFPIATQEPDFAVKTFPNRLELELDFEPSSSSNLNGFVSMSGDGFYQAEQLPSEEVVQFSGLPPSAGPTVCLALEPRGRCNFEECSEPYRRCKEVITEATEKEEDPEIKYGVLNGTVDDIKVIITPSPSVGTTSKASSYSSAAAVLSSSLLALALK